MTDQTKYPSLKNRTVFITGGATGIGAAMVRAFSEQGAKVAFVDLAGNAAHDLGTNIEQSTGMRPWFRQLDITDIAALQSAINDAAAELGPLHTLVNNAANDVRHSTQEVTEAFWDQTQAINLKAYFFACQAVIKGMQANGGGAIINFSSISYMMGNAGYPSYTTANAGITGLTRSMAREFGRDRIRVNTIAPGWVLTEKQKELWVTPEALAAHVARQCLTDTLEPADIVPTVLFLASSASKMVTSQLWAVDGGVVVSG